MQFPQAFHGHPGYLAVWIVTLWLRFGPEIVLSILLRSKRTARRSDKGSKFLVILAANLAVPIGFAAANLFPSLSIVDRWPVVFGTGIVVWLGGSLFRFYSMWMLGRFFTYDVAISTGQHVVERGPYRWLRHPSYLGSWQRSVSA